MKELVRYIACNIVDEPDKVDVREVEKDKARVIELRVSERDLGKIIGKQGRTAKSIRTLMAASGIKNGTRCSLEIIED